MSFETFPCGSPCVSPEEPAPSLYVENPDEDPSRLLIKKPMESEPSRLAETANIEDKIMNEDEIAQVNASGGEGLKNNTLSEDGRTRKNGDDSARRVEGRHVYDKFDIARPHWIHLNYGNPATSPAHSSLLKEQQLKESLPSGQNFESGDRASVIIKRSKEQEEIESDSDNESQDTSKVNTNDSLRCNENISGIEASEENVASLHGHSRAIYYNYDVNHEELRKLQDKGNAKLVRGIHGEAKAVPIYYMPAGYSHMVAMPGGSSAGNANMLQRDHFAKANSNEVKRLHLQQHLDYVAGRPEQQVPVASNVNTSERYGNLQHGSAAPGIQYVDRRLMHGGYAMVPGIGPVFYQGIPVGGDQSHYENFTSLQQQFVPMSNIPAETTSSQPQAQPTTSSGANTDHAHQRSQEKLLNASKPYASPVHHTSVVSPASSLEEKRLTNSPAVKSESGSPSPVTVAEDGDGKRGVQAKLKGKPKPASGTSKPEIKCEQCGKTFGSSSALAKHKLTHSDERKYVCGTCGKGFKRQDHLNGHMVTHRDKKPYECNFSDCDKSYCDMRSLRRHLENHHTANGMSDSRTHGAVSPSSDKPTVVNVERADSPRNLTKLVKGRSLKDRTDHLHASGYDSGRSSGRSTPGSTHDPGVARERPTNLPLEGAALNPLRERNSDSFSSTASEEVVGNSGEQSVPEKSTEAPKPVLAGDLLKQAADRFKTQQIGRNPGDMWQERFQQQPYMVYHPYGTSEQQWYPTMYAQNPRFVYQYHSVFPSTVYQMPVTGLVSEPRQRMMSDSDTPEVTKTVSGSSQLKPSPSQENNRPTDAMQLAYLRQHPVGRATGTPTDPTAVAVATAKEMGHFRYAGESYYGAHPQGTQWQQVRYDEATNAYNSATSMGNSKSSGYGHATVPDSNGLANSDAESNHLDTVSRGTQFRPGKLDTNSEPPEKRQRLSEVSAGEREGINGALHGQIKLEDNNNSQEKAREGLFRNPAEIVTPRRKQRPRPEPLTIPPSASTTYYSNRPNSPMSRSRPCSPPYTPPPMLSPRSIYSIGNITPRLGPAIQVPTTPSRLQLLSSHSHKSFDLIGDEEALPFPEPKINVGREFQAEVPPFAGHTDDAKYDEHKATLVWKPVDEKKRSRREEIESFLEMACSVAVLGGGSNKEYALHILHRANGNVKEAVKLLLCQKYIAQQGDPMYDYHYEGSVRWASKERQIFRQNFRTKGKEFNEIKKDVGDKKTIFDCIEFYYQWKAAYPEAIRGRTRYIDSDSDEDYEDTSSETNSNPSFFECDFPQCNAKFVSRQALNGHIRVHGGSFMKPSEPRRKNRNTTVAASNGSNPGHVVRKRKSPSPAPATSMSELNNQDGPLPEFACKVCGRIFHKIKSRSAHMKTHVKRPDDDDSKMAAKLTSSKSH